MAHQQHQQHRPPPQDRHPSSGKRKQTDPFQHPSTAPGPSPGPAQPPPGDVPVLIRKLSELCHLAMGGFETYFWLATLSVTAEETGDSPAHLVYRNFMQHTSNMLENVRRRIEHVRLDAAVDFSDFGQRYWMLPSYRALLACEERVTGLLYRLNNHYKSFEFAGGRILHANPQLKADVESIQKELETIDQSWWTCMRDVQYMLQFPGTP